MPDPQAATPPAPEQRKEPLPNFEIIDDATALLRERHHLGLQEGSQPAALCLSGGGIRSAAFCLGAIQALARNHLLHQFHYLSTVSGGGYTGAWLTRCIAERHDEREPGRDVVKEVEKKILVRDSANEAPEIAKLRKFTNYLTPHPGLASSDTWAGIVLWLRNTMVNWFVFGPLAFMFCCAALCYEFLLEWVMVTGRPTTGLIEFVSLVALICLAVAVFGACINLPSHSHHDHDVGHATANGSAVTDDAGKPVGLNGGSVFRRIIAWALGWTFLAPLALASQILHAGPGDPDAVFTVAGLQINRVQMLPLLSFAVCLVCYAFAAAWVALSCNAEGDKGRNRAKHLSSFGKSAPGWVVSSGISALILWSGTQLAVAHQPLWLAIAGPPWVIAAETFRSAAYVAMRKKGLRTELDREWLARLSGSKLRTVLAVALLMLASLYLPALIFGMRSAFLAAVVSVTGFLTGPIAALIGKSAHSLVEPAGAQQASSAVPKLWLIDAAVIVFAAAIFMLLGHLALTLALQTAHLFSLAPSPLHWGLCSFVLGAVAGSLALGVDRVVNLNDFSLLAVYRNRLIRAFLGTARPSSARRADRFTNFDPSDDIRMHDTFKDRTRLFPVINVALNRTSGQDTARAERKAAPFTITPLYCGSPTLADGAGAYVPTALFAREEMLTGPQDDERGITIGTAMALSGAAASPNMGYHSSPALAFVMTLFNVRLGAWLPNPGGSAVPNFEKIMARPGPRVVIPTMLDELLGQSSDTGRYIYLSDGGHFENLGLYEMLRRRASLIVVIDADADKDYRYQDLGQSLQRALIDSNVSVEFLKPVRTGDAKLAPCGAYAKIVYPESSTLERATGRLIYLKPFVPDSAPMEIQAFRALKQNFPHEPTVNQFFTESEFESYRRLGEHITGQAVSTALAGFDYGPDEEPELARVFDGLQRLARVPD